MTRIFWDTSLFLYLFEGGDRADEVKRLREKGHRVTLLNEGQFWRLAGKRSI